MNHGIGLLLDLKSKPKLWKSTPNSGSLGRQVQVFEKLVDMLSFIVMIRFQLVFEVHIYTNPSSNAFSNFVPIQFLA